MASYLVNFTQLDRDNLSLLLTPISFDFENVEVYVLALLQRLDAKCLEKESSADLQQWLIDFDGCHLLLKAEYYSSSMWLEAMTVNNLDELVFIQQLLAKG